MLVSQPIRVDRTLSIKYNVFFNQQRLFQLIFRHKVFYSYPYPTTSLLNLLNSFLTPLLPILPFVRCKVTKKNSVVTTVDYRYILGTQRARLNIHTKVAVIRELRQLKLFPVSETRALIQYSDLGEYIRQLQTINTSYTALWSANI